MESKASRSARVKLQLRDSKGRWVKMFSKVKWSDSKTSQTKTGIVSGFDGNSAVIDVHDRHGKNLGVKETIDAGQLEVINEKAEIKFDANGKAIGAIPADSADPANQQDQPQEETKPAFHVKATNPTSYNIGFDGEGSMYAQVGDLALGDELYPIAKASATQKSPFNSFKAYSNANIQKFAKGLGTVSKIKEGKYAEVTEPDGTKYYISAGHFAVKRSPEMDKAILQAQQSEAETVHKGKDAPFLEWIEALKNSKESNTAEQPKAVIPETPEAAPEAAPKAEESPFGENFVKKPSNFNFNKGDVAVFKDGTTGDWVGKGQVPMEGGGKISANKFIVDGKEKVVEGKDIVASYSPKSLVIPTTGPNPFGDEFKGYSFDLSKPNNENFKAGDHIVYGKEKNLGKILSVNPTTILVEKLNSDKKYNGKATISKSQISGKYVKEGTPAQIGKDASKDVPEITQDELDQIGKIDHEKVDDQLKNGVKPTAKAQETYPDKGKSITNPEGQVIKVNDVVFNPKYGKGVVAIVLPSSDPNKLGSARVFYESEGGFKVTQAKNLALFDPEKIVAEAPKTTSDKLSPGDVGMNPETGKQFITGKDGNPIHKGDKISYTKGGKTSEGTVKGIYVGEKTVSITWDDGTTTGPKKASTLVSAEKASEAPVAENKGAEAPAPAEAPEASPEAAPAAEKYSAENEKALLAFSTNAKDIGDHLRGIAAHAFAGAEEIILGLDNVLKNSTLSEPTKVYRGFKLSKDMYGVHHVLDSFKVGEKFRDKSFTSTSLDPAIAQQSLDAMEGDHEVLIDFDLPAGFHAAKLNYDGFSDESMKGLSHEQEVILPRGMSFQITAVSETTDENGNKKIKASVKGVVNESTDGLNDPSVHQVKADEPVEKNPFKMLDDPGADGDGFHPSGPWGHFGAAGVMVQAKNENGEPVYLIVENGELHEGPNQGLWQLPGGALNGNENPYQGAAREMWEELDVDPDMMSKFTHAGDIKYSNGKGWAYNNVAAVHDGPPFDVKIDVIETSDHKWATKAELLEMMNDGKLLPAFAANIEKLLDVYGDTAPETPATPEPDATPEAAPILDFKDFTKVPNKHQSGSNTGGFYTNAAGEEYYIKTGMSEDHARNEILASAIYAAMGVNASKQEPIMVNGKLGIASKIIATDGSGSNQNLNNPEYLAKVQEDFAIDVLVANWDVAGMGYDNLLTDAQGNPLRIDPGASLRYRAQGAKKSSFDGSANEWDFLRDASNNESSGLKYNKKLFGSMTDQQLIDSANKLNELTDEKLDGIVNSIGFDEKNAEFFKSTLKARREDILARASKLTPETKDDNGPATAEDINTPAADTGSEEGGQIQLDSGPAGDAGAPAGGEAQPEVGSLLTHKQLDALPAGSVVQYTNQGTPLTKLENGNWKGDSHEMSDDTIKSIYKDSKLTLKSLGGTAEETPADAPEAGTEPKVGSFLLISELDALPAGSVVAYPESTTALTKQEDGSWATNTGKMSDEQVKDIYVDGDLELLGLGSVDSALDDKPTNPYFLNDPIYDFEELQDIPAGSVIAGQSGMFYYHKVAPGQWKSTNSGEHYKDEDFEGVTKMQVISYAEPTEAPAFDTAEPIDTSGPKVGDNLTQHQVVSLPVGSVVVYKGQGTFKKVDEDTFMNHLGNKVLTQDILAVFDDGELALSEIGDGKAWAPADEDEEEKLWDFKQIKMKPVGTVIEALNGVQYEKLDEGIWKAVGSQMEYDDEDFEYATDLKIVKEGDGTFNTPTTPEVDPLMPVNGEKVYGDDIDKLPIGAVIQTLFQSKFTKTEGGWKGTNGSIIEEFQLKNYTKWTVVSGGADASPEGFVPGAKVSTQKLSELPLDTVVKTSSGTEFTKSAPSYWSANGVGGWTTGNLINTNPGSDTVTIVSVPDEVPVDPNMADMANLSKYPTGTILDPGGSAKLVKQASGLWKSTYTGTTFTDSEINQSYTEGELKVIEPKVVKTGDQVPVDEIKDLPIGTEFYDDENVLFSKTDTDEYMSEDGGTFPAEYFKDFNETVTIATTVDTDLLSSMAEEAEAAQAAPLPSVTGKNGEALLVGDNIVWESKGTSGSIVGLDVENGKVQMLLNDGTKKWYAASKMVKAPKPVYMPQPKKTAEVDKDSPWYDQPKPELVIPEEMKPTVTDPADYNFLPEGFIEEIEQRYAAKINPTWSKDKPQDSYYWSKVTHFQGTGSMDSLQTLHTKQYISDEMFEKAKAFQKDLMEKRAKEDALVAEAKAKYAKELADLQSKYLSDLKAWKAANGIVSTSVANHFPDTAEAEWDKETGYIKNADGSISADWSKAPAGSYSVASIMASMTDDEILAAHGMSAMVDSEWIRDNNVRFTKVVDENGVTKLQARFEVNEFKKKAVIAEMGNDTISHVKGGFLGYVKGALASFSKFTKGGDTLSSIQGKTYRKMDGDTEITLQVASNHSGGYNNTNAFSSFAYVTMPENASAADFEKALRAMGIADAHPSDKASVDFSKKKQIVSTFGGFVGEANTKYEQNPALLDQDVKKALDGIGASQYTIDDFRLVMTEMGFNQFRLPKALRNKLAAQTGVKAYVHGNIDWMPESVAKGAMYSPDQINDSHGPIRAMKRFLGQASGYLATARRMVEGDNASGMSPGADIGSGGARYLFTTPQKGNSWQTNTGYNSGMVAHPTLAFKYLGAYANYSDYGDGTRVEGKKVLDELTSHSSLYEMMVPNGISIADTWYTFTNSTQKEKILAELRENGVEEINGMPIEKYFVVPGKDPVPEWIDTDPYDD